MSSLWKHMRHLSSPYWTVYSSTSLQTASSFSLLPTHLIVKGTILCLGRIQMHKEKKELRIYRPMSDVSHLLIDWVYTPFLCYVNLAVDFIKHYNGWQRSISPGVSNWQSAGRMHHMQATLTPAPQMGKMSKGVPEMGLLQQP